MTIVEISLFVVSFVAIVAVGVIISQAQTATFLRQSLSLNEKMVAAQEEKNKALERSVEAYQRWVDALQEQVHLQQGMIKMHNDFLTELENYRREDEPLT